ncbi:MAG TPA: cytochrome c [Burkholderiales bacterium]|nr:cytochrome c [Burkholderiales bacterium]
MKKQLVLAASAALLSTGALAASQGASVFEEVCAACHGEKGQGIPGLAPPLKGSEFVKKTDNKALADFIQHGRAGKEKHFPQFPSDMPPYSGGAAKAQAVADYVKGDLQK